MKRPLFKTVPSILTAFGILTVVGCSSSIDSSTGFNVTLLQPKGAGCNYEIAAAQVKTLQSLSNLTGAVGQVVTSPLDLDSRPDILGSGYSMRPVDVTFYKSGATYFPANYDSLVAVSLYNAVEQSYEVYATLNPRMDLLTSYPNVGKDTWIVHDAKRMTTSTTGGPEQEVADNAEYFSVQNQSSVGDSLRNFIFSYPNLEVTQMPLAVNVGIIAHEFSHLVFNHYFWEPAGTINTSGAKPTQNTLSSLDEGVADYIGYLATQDPSFFLCSFPTENRDLSKPKIFSADVVARIQSNGSDFDAHEGGAIFAAINYEIGTALGDQRKNGALIAALIPYLLQCQDTRSGNSLSLNFRDVGACHARLAADDSTRNTIKQIYSKYLGAYGGI